MDSLSFRYFAYGDNDEQHLSRTRVADWHKKVASSSPVKASNPALGPNAAIDEAPKHGVAIARACD